MKKLIFFATILGIAGAFGSSFSFTRTKGIIGTLTLAPWTSLQVWEDNTGTGAYTQTPYDCIEDNNWIFSTDSTLLMLEDSLKCIPDFPEGDTMRFSWELRLSGDFISLISEYDTEEEMVYEVLSIGDDSLVLLKVEDQYHQNIIHEKLILQR